MGLMYSAVRAAARSGPASKPAYKVTDRRAGAQSLRPAWAPQSRAEDAPGAELALPAPKPIRRPDDLPAAFKTPEGIALTTSRDGLPDLGATLDWVAHTLTYAGTLTNSADPSAPPILGWGSEHAVTVATLWAAHTHARLPCRNAAHGHSPDTPGKLVTTASPRLGIFASAAQSEEFGGGGSGKTYLGKQTLRFCANPTMEDEPTGPALARMLGYEHATIAIDEGDILFGAGARKEMVRSILNNGYSPDGHHSHAVGARTEVARMSTYGAVLVCAIDSVEKKDSLKPLLSRFIKMRLIKAPKGYRPQRLRRSDEQGVKALTAHLNRRITENLKEIALYEGDMPGYMEARTAEIWEPLYAIAAAAGTNSRWPQRVAAAADWFENGGEARAAATAAWVKGAQALAGLDTPFGFTQ